MGQVWSDIEDLTEKCCCEDRHIEKLRKRAEKLAKNWKGNSNDQPAAESSRPEVAPETFPTPSASDSMTLNIEEDPDAMPSSRAASSPVSPTAKRSGQVFRAAATELSPQHSVGSSEMESPDRRMSVPMQLKHFFISRRLFV